MKARESQDVEPDYLVYEAEGSWNMFQFFMVFSEIPFQHA
jgi:hypothetical protein